MSKSLKEQKGISVKKSENFSEWFSEIIQKAELADLRYNVKGFLIFQPWSVKAMELIYDKFEYILQKKGHEPYWFPTLIPESNLNKESTHIQGFTPQVFWVTSGGNNEFEEKLALRPTSETAFYQMFSLWLRSYKQLPFKTYQRANVFRYETKATRPFLRSREFHWIETHCLFDNIDNATKQVYEDMETTKEILHDLLGLPFIFFERPSWDKFPGASRTFAADVLNPDGRFIQQPSTHLIKQDFLKAFNVSFKNNNGKDETPFSTCYGPSISRIFASVISVHGDDKGLRFPWDISPYHIVFVALSENANKKAQNLQKKFSNYRTYIDTSDKSAGEKFNIWELKGVPLRVDIGNKELKDKKLSIYRRDINKKDIISEEDFIRYVEKISKEFSKNLIMQANKKFHGRIKNSKNIEDVKKMIENGFIARCNFCSIGNEGIKCAEKIEKEVSASVRGVKLEKEKVFGDCVICGKKASCVVYIGKSY